MIPLRNPQPIDVIREGTVVLTPAQAGWVVTNLRYEHQRDEGRAKGHLATLAESMRRGQWLDKSQLDFARVGRRLILVNGHHRLRAQSQTNVDIVWNIAFHECADEAAVRSLYYRFDTDLRVRSSANIVQGIGLAEASGLQKQTATALWDAAQLIGNGMRFRRYSQNGANLMTDDRAAICYKLLDEAATAESAIKKAPARLRGRLRSVSSFALMLVTLKHQPEAARDFWFGLCDDDGLRKGDPRKTLLLDMQSRTGSKGLLAGNLMAASKAWNAFYQERSLVHLKVTGHDVKIDGTPYTVSA